MNSGYKAFLLLLSFVCSMVQAAENGGVAIGGTRLIYEGDKKEASLSITNSDSNPYLIQSWVESQTENAAKPPFIITPPLFRLDGEQQNLLRIIFTGGNLPNDRESLFWLNVKTIPATLTPEDVNTLQIAVRTRIKLIYRPTAVKGTPEDVTRELTWHKNGSKLTVTNPTPFYMNFSEVTVGGRAVSEATFVAPMSTTSFSSPANASGRIAWKIISDYGGIGEPHTVEN